MSKSPIIPLDSATQYVVLDGMVSFPRNEDCAEDFPGGAIRYKSEKKKYHFVTI
jgi:hypothetical protein